jgi:transcriptional regulator with XRE-family HTH domain
MNTATVRMQNDPGIDLDKLAAHLRTKRGDRALRGVAQEIGSVSASTLSRIEQGGAPDLPTFVRICAWLGLSADEFLEPATGFKRRSGAPSETDLPEVIEAQLRQDGVLPTTTVNAISEMIRIAYQAAGTDHPKPKARKNNRE